MVLLKGTTTAGTAAGKMVSFISSVGRRITYRLVTPVAEYEFRPLFNPENRYEKDTEIVVYPLEPGHNQAAGRAKAGGLIDYPCFGRHPRDKDHVAILKCLGLQTISRILKSNRLD